MTQAIQRFTKADDLKVFLADQYQAQINTYFQDDKKALKFLTSVVADVQRNPKLLECSPDSLINSYLIMASVKLNPSAVSGEAYVIPYKGKATFQLGYKGILTLLYRAGARKVMADVVYENDDFDFTNGVVTHKPDVFSADRGAIRGAYCVITMDNGEEIPKVMSQADIVEIGEKYSQSFSSSFSPWQDKHAKKWMLIKTVIKQCHKLANTNSEDLEKALVADNGDSNIEQQKKKAEQERENRVRSQVEALNACKTLDELKAVWGACDKREDLILKAKDEVKDRLTPNVQDAEATPTKEPSTFSNKLSGTGSPSRESVEALEDEQKSEPVVTDEITADEIENIK